MNDRLKRLTENAIKFIQEAEKVALRMDERGIHVAFSGGKDSQVLLALVEMSGCKHHAEMQVTSVDTPNLMRFIRQHYPQVKLNLPKRTMRELILRNGMLPTRQARYCCAELKEKAGAGCCTAIGIRKEESTRRARRNAVEIIGQRINYDIMDGKLYEHQDTWGGQLFDNEKQSNVYCVGGKDKMVISPLLEWTRKDIWEFIKENNMPYCDLYDKGFQRIGCLFCPMASVKEKQHQLSMFARFADKIYIPAIRELMERGKYGFFNTPQEVFQWWISNESSKEWLFKLNHPKLF